MKVLLCERNLNGHRRTYLTWLLKISEIDFYLYAPENLGVREDHFLLYGMHNLRSFKSYRKWIHQISQLVKNKGIDVVHILDGDSIMRFMGGGFSTIKAKRTIITFHHFFKGNIRRLSYQLMSSLNSNLFVVHTNNFKKELYNIGIKNAVQCVYPSFDFYRITKDNKYSCKKIMGLKSDIPTIGIVGGISSYKNIIPFLMILRKCSIDFQLLICGKPSDVEVNDINNAVQPYSSKVKMVLRKLTDEEYIRAIVASDIIYSIYSLDFDGASGPLNDGVCAEKLILSSDHGSLGEIVSENFLGITTEVDNENDILTKTELALSHGLDYKYCEKALNYRDKLKPEKFLTRYKSIYEMNPSME